MSASQKSSSTGSPNITPEYLEFDLGDLSLRSDAIARMARDNLMAFNLATDPNYQDSWLHVELANVLQKAYEDLIKGKSVRIILEIPPRYGKSKAATIQFPGWVFGKSPTWPIIVASYAADLAEDFGLKTRDLVSSEAYKAIFDTRLRADTSARGKWQTAIPDPEGSGMKNLDGGYTAAGVGGPITGKGGKILLVDDPFKNREEADSPTVREKVWNWYTSTLYTRKEGVAAIIVIATRWHDDDLIGRLKRQEVELEQAGLPHDRWEVIRFPAIADHDEPHRKKGEALWPEKFPLEELEKIRNNIGVYDFASLYQQIPILAEDAIIKKEWFKYFDEETLLAKEIDVYVLIDPAISQKDDSDNTGFLVVGKEHEGPNIYVLEDLTAKLDPLEIVDLLFFVQNKYKGNFVRAGIETQAYQKSLMYYVEEKMRKLQTYFDVVDVKAKGSKVERVKGLVPLYRTGVIWHRHSQYELEGELLTFPKGRRDDRPDALSQLLQVIEVDTGTHVATQFRPQVKRY